MRSRGRSYVNHPGADPQEFTLGHVVFVFSQVVDCRSLLFVTKIAKNVISVAIETT
ncbi:hypothetical protein NORO109296_00055 [Nocardiopsis rhodophaea]